MLSFFPAFSFLYCVFVFYSFGDVPNLCYSCLLICTQKRINCKLCDLDEVFITDCTNQTSVVVFSILQDCQDLFLLRGFGHQDLLKGILYSLTHPNTFLPKAFFSFRSLLTHHFLRMAFSDHPI